MYANNKLAIKILKLCELNVHTENAIDLTEIKKKFSAQEIETCCRELAETNAIEYEARHNE